jgi:cell division protein FtsB
MLNQLSLEMRRLRFIVLNLELDNQQLKIAQLERDLGQMRAERLKLVVQESDLRQGIAELDTALSGLSLDGEDRPKLATAKADLEGNRLVMVYGEQQAIAQREAELTGRLQQEQQRLQELSARGEKLKGEK